MHLGGRCLGLGALGLVLAACPSANNDMPAGQDGDSSTGADIGESGHASDDTTAADDSTDGEQSSTSGADDDDGTTGEVPLVPTDLLLIESVVFYDGYAEPVDEPLPEGVIRLNNAIHAVRVTDEQLAVIQPNLEMQVLIGALCDNYDRIGSVQLALVPKGAETYDPAEVSRIEVARFITPFMNKNKEPDTVPYEWDIDGVADILTDPDLQAEFDFWFELEVFGVPYAANTEVSGCEGRNDVFRGWLALHTDSTDEAGEFDTLIPVAVKDGFNNYQEGASDRIGTTRKTIEIVVEEATEYAQLVLITSNHGANAGGEEYARREHFVSIDGDLALQYRPGRDTCEPFRMFNTQGNGIYGPSPKSDEEWQSFSNWCPGDVIDTRVVAWGPVAAGVHEIVIDVPDATFADGQGNFPLSLYVQAR